MDDYLAKPVTGEALHAAIERWTPGPGPLGDDLDLGVLRQLTAETAAAPNSQLIRDLAGLFREDSNRGLKQVADALREQDAQGVARAAHALKGSSGQLGATRTEAISAELQAVAESGELGSAKALLRRLETAVDAAQSALSSALPDDEVACRGHVAPARDLAAPAGARLPPRHPRRGRRAARARRAAGRAAAPVHAPHVGVADAERERVARRAARLRVLLRRGGARGRAVLDPHRRGPRRHARPHQGVRPRPVAVAAGRRRPARARHVAGDLPLRAPRPPVGRRILATLWGEG